jgi:hypothetical protein
MIRCCAPRDQMYCKSLRGMGIMWIPSRVYPLLLFLGFIAAMTLPWSQRKGMWVTIKDSVIAPFALAKFRETFLADVMTSVVKVFVDLVYTFCFFFTGTDGWSCRHGCPAVVILPSSAMACAGEWKDDTMISCSNRFVVTNVIAFFVPGFPLVCPCAAPLQYRCQPSECSCVYRGAA